MSINGMHFSSGVGTGDHGRPVFIIDGDAF